MNDKLFDSGMLNRRDFCKLKFFLMFYTYFSNLFGGSLLETTNKEKINYSILDKLLSLPFSQTVKEEVSCRVSIQKKYSFNSNGYLQPLNRCLCELIDYIIYSKNVKDFKLLCSIKDPQIDYTYALNRTARRGTVKQMEYIQKNLLGINNNMLQDALIYAFKSKSAKSVLYLLEQKIKIDKSTQNKIFDIFKHDEYEMFQKELMHNSNTKFLPFISAKNKLKVRKMTKKQIDIFCQDVFYREENLYAIVYNALVDLYKQKYIDDFSIKLREGKVFLFTWNNNGVYAIDFVSTFHKTLLLNGFNNENMSMRDYQRDISKDIKFIRAEEQKRKYYTEDSEYSFNQYGFINAEIL